MTDIQQSIEIIYEHKTAKTRGVLLVHGPRAPRDGALPL